MGSLFSYVHLYSALPSTLTSISFQAGLFSAILTAFVVPKILDLKVNPLDQSVYYQNQTVYMLDRISQQFASVDHQISSNYPPPSPYPTFHPSASDRRVTILWLVSLVCSLSAAHLATLVQQWARGYIRMFQQFRNPGKAARIRQFLFEGANRLPSIAEFVPFLIHISLVLFFWGLVDLLFQIDMTVFITTGVPILICVCLYICCVVESIRNPQSPYRTTFSRFLWSLTGLIKNLSRSLRYGRFHGKGVKATSIEKHQEQCSMEVSKSLMSRDVRAIQWLVGRTNGSDEMQALILAVPGSFDGKWGQEVWKGVVGDHSTSLADDQAGSHPESSSTHENYTVSELCRRVRYFFETCKDEGKYIDTGIGRTRRMRGYVETAASLVCCAGVEVGLFGEVGEVLSEVGDNENTNNPLIIRSSPSFTLRLTCLSLVAIRKMIDDNSSQLHELAKLALEGFAQIRMNYGYQDTRALMDIAQRIDDFLSQAWAPVVDLHLAFKSWSLNRPESDIKQVLNSHRASISELERIATEVGGMEEEVDWHFTFLLDTIDQATHRLIQRLPGVFFEKPKPDRPIVISEAFDFPSVGDTPVPPQLVPPGRQIQSLCTLGRKLRDIIEEQNTESHEETLKSLESLSNFPVSPLRGLNYLMKRQLWRLLELRDGGCLGFTIELFFHVLRQLELSTTSLSSELKEAYYTGTFNAITFDWENCKNSAGTQRILLDLLCDLVIGSRGAFSNFSYPPYVVEMLLELVGKMVKGHEGFCAHIDEIIQELEEANFRSHVDYDLRDKALNAIYLSRYHGSST